MSGNVRAEAAPFPLLCQDPQPRIPVDCRKRINIMTGTI